MTTQALAKPTTMTVRTAVPLSRQLRRGLIYFLLIFFAILFLIPVYMVLVTSVKTFDQVSLSTMWEFPKEFTLAAFAEALEKLSPNLMNSLALVLPGTLISAMIGSINGYVLSKWKFRGANVIFPLMLFGMFIPYQAILIPLVQFMGRICLSYDFAAQTCNTSLYGNIIGLMVVHVVYGIPITTLIFRNYYAEVPTELIEAGSIDGAGFWGIYRHVIFPISAPGFVVVVIWQFTQLWNEFLFAVSIVTASDKVPVTVALVNLSGAQVVEWNVLMAGAFLTALPTLLVYIVLGRYFIRGLLAGSIKG
jgi:glucose/mannose transport system permease protein